MDKDRPKKLHYGYVIVFCCTLVMFINVGLVLSCAGIFFGPVSAELGVPVGSVGMFLSFNFIFSAITLSFAGKLMEKFGARLLLTASSVAMGVCLLAMSRFNALWQFYVAGAVFGVTLAFLLYLGFPTIIPRWFKKRVGFFIGICSAGSGIGGAIFNPVAGWLITEYGWRTAYAVFGIVVLAAVSPVLGILLRNDPAEMGLKPYGEEDGTAPGTAAKSPEVPEGPEYREVLKMPVFYGLFAFAFLMNATAILFQYIPKYAGTLNFSLEQASFAASAAMIGATVGKIALGIINDKSIALGLAATIGLGVAGLTLMLAGHWGLAVLVGGEFLFGWAYGGVSVQTPLLVRAALGRRSYAQVFSNISIAFSVAGAVAATAWGFLAEQSGYPVILLIGIGLLTVCGAIGFCALKAGRILKSNSKEGTEA
ncbi:MAG: MFS transporter [Lentisphaeria bacterium]|nr:MFS transporter [Lentisphaeria bacterium]